MDVILVPGLWLDASCWRDVADLLMEAGHSPFPVALRGLDSRTADRRGTMMADHVAEIVATIDRCRADILLVGHAESCGLVHAALNRRPDRIDRVVYVGGFPSADGAQVLGGFALGTHGETTHTAGHRAIDPSLEVLHRRMTDNAPHVLDAVQRLTDERRFDVPVTLLATEFRSADVQRWMDADVDPARELALMADVTLVDLPSGRCPQLESPKEVADVLIAQMARRERAGI